MKLVKTSYQGGMTVHRIIYDDSSTSELFFPKLYIDIWSKKHRYWLKTLTGLKISIDEDKLRKLNLMLTSVDIGVVGRQLNKRFMVLNKSKDPSEKIPLVKMSKKLKKPWRTCINVEREHKNRRELEYRGWCPVK